MVCKQCKREFRHRTGSYCGSCQPLRATVESVQSHVSNLLSGAIDGTIPEYRHVQDGQSFIRWGRVERDIRDAISILTPHEAPHMTCPRKLEWSAGRIVEAKGD